MQTVDANLEDQTRILFEQWMEQCYQDSIQVILVNSPIYYEATAKCKDISKLNNYYDSIATKYNSHYLNYTENYAICNDTTNFSVSVHMTPTATDIFSKDFADTLKTLIK